MKCKIGMKMLNLKINSKCRLNVSVLNICFDWVPFVYLLPWSYTVPGLMGNILFILLFFCKNLFNYDTESEKYQF